MSRGCAYVDECGVCDDDPLNDCIQDCNGDWGGDAYLDECGVCDEDPTNDCIQDCNGDWGGIAYINSCGICVDGNTNLENINENGYELGMIVLEYVLEIHILMIVEFVMMILQMII